MQDFSRYNVCLKNWLRSSQILNESVMSENEVNLFHAFSTSCAVTITELNIVMVYSQAYVRLVSFTHYANVHFFKLNTLKKLHRYTRKYEKE